MTHKLAPKVNYRRKLLFADFVRQETAWAHIQAAQTLMQAYLRFAHAQSPGQSLFRPFVLPKPYRAAKEVFCLRETRVVNGFIFELGWRSVDRWPEANHLSEWQRPSSVNERQSSDRTDVSAPE